MSWKANLQHVVTLSTTEDEFIALTKALNEAKWMQGIAEMLGLKQPVTKVLCDSQSAIHLARNQVYHERTKHTDVRLY